MHLKPRDFYTHYDTGVRKGFCGLVYLSSNLELENLSRIPRGSNSQHNHGSYKEIIIRNPKNVGSLGSR